MTQILGVVTRKCVFHVSDRLLSRRTLHSVQPFNPNSNKAVIFCATDAQVIASYTGRAFLDHMPTDTFIAQSLLGRALSGGAFLGVGCPSTWTDLGRSVERLRQDLSAAFRRLSSADRVESFEVSVLGWRQRHSRNRRITPVIWELRRPTDGIDCEFQATRHRRWWGWDRGYTLSAVPTVTDASIVEWMRGELRMRGNESPDEIKRILVATLYKCSVANPGIVGRACLLIALTPTASPQARVRYIADSSRPLDPTPDNVGYLPWVVAPPMAFAPALIRSTSGAGGWTNVGTGYSWTIDGLEPTPGPMRASQASQPRPPDPQKRQ